MAASLVFLTPLGGLAAFAVLLVAAAYVVGVRRVRRIRALLGLEPASGKGEGAYLAALAAVPLLLAVAAMQPAWERAEERRVRTDAQVYVVIDTSRSMLASKLAGSPTRLERAKSLAVAIRADMPGLAVGVGTLTDRVLPNLLPSPSERSFASTVRLAVDIEQPPPSSTGVKVSTLSALQQVPAGGTFAPTAKHRAVIVLTDGETAPFDPGSVASAYSRAPATQLVLVHVWGAGEGIYAADGAPEGAYRPDPASTAALASLAVAAGGRAFAESDGAGAVARAVVSALGSGPTVGVGTEPRTRTLGRFAALAALIPLAFILWRRNLR